MQGGHDVRMATIASRRSLVFVFASFVVMTWLAAVTQPVVAEDAYNPYGTPGGKYGGQHPGASLFATSQPNIFYHDVGLLELFISNIGRVGNGQLGLDSVSAGWRGGEYLYIGAMWIGAIAPDNLSYVSTGGYDLELLPSLDPVDTIYPSFEGSVGGNRPGFSPRPDDDGDGLVDEEFLNGKDDDLDGLIDEDYAAISQQMYACEYWDYTDLSSELNPEHRPLNLRVRQRSYAWSTAGSNEFIGFDFDIINDGFESLRQVYLGFFVDSDAGPKDADGYWTDDGVALFTTDTTFTDNSVTYTCNEDGPGGQQTTVDCSRQEIHMDIMYMYDIPDDGEDVTGGDVDGYFGGMFLGHTTDPSGERAPARAAMHTARYFSGSNPYPAGDPRNDAERYDLLQSGDQSTRPSGQPGDYRYTFSAGPFTELLPGEELQLQVAFVIGEGRGGMITNALNAQRIYNGRWRDVDGNPNTPPPDKPGAETCLVAPEEGVSLFWRDPCDSLAPTQLVIKETTCIPSNYVDNDCNCCTPLPPSANEPGVETLINWVGTVAPPPPGTNSDLDDVENAPHAPGLSVVSPAGDRRVDLQWDNLSELTADPIQGEILFGGYKVWRVEGWDRPVGSVGPDTDEWQLLADISLDPPDGLGLDSPWHLSKYTNFIDSTECLAQGPCFRVNTGASDADSVKIQYPVGRYSYVDTLGLKNGMVYFYDITAYSAWTDENGIRFELESLPTATEDNSVVPVWTSMAAGNLDDVIVVPNPYIAGENPEGWDLTPSDADPTGTKIAFANLPARECTVNVYSLAGDLIRAIPHDGRSGNGTAFWDLISRNGQDIVSGVYIYSVECGSEQNVGRFTVIR